MKTQPNPLRAAALALAYAIATAVLGGFAPPQANAQVSLQGVYPRSANANVFEQATEDLPAVIILRNDGPEDVSVEGYSLSDDPTDVAKWVIPAGWTIPRNGGTLNIFADEKDERPGPGQGELHTNFLYDCRVPRLIVANPNKQVVLNYSDGTLKDCPPCEGNIVLGKRYDARVWVPRPGAGLPKDWEFPGFSDADWQVGSLGVGYDRGAEDPICDGLILYHTNDDVDLISGPAFPLIEDISGGGAQHDGELRNGVNDGAGGQVDQSFFFIDGAHIRVPHHDELEPGAGSFAAATWVYVDDPGDEYAVMCKRDSSGAGWDISLAGDRAIFRIVTTGGKTFADASPQGSIRGQEWVHLALVVDRVNRELRGYVDGTKVVSVPIDSDDVKADADLNFARHPVANQANPLRGGMDEVAIWNRSLTDVEADTIYQRGRDKKRLKDTAGGAGGPGGSGLYDPLINFDVESLMYGQNSTILIRCPFDLQGVDPSLITRMTIKMHYDDGFIMYLNGNEIARENAPTAPPGPFSASLGPRPDGQALAASVYEITDPAVFASLTTAFNSNVLAVHGLNENPNADRFVILPEICIEFRDPPGECIKDTLGTEFWLAFPENYPDRSGNPLQLKLCITGPPQTSGEVRFPGFSRLGTKTWTITENGGNCVVDVDVPASLELSGDEAIEDKAVQVVSFGTEVAVYATTHINYSTDTYHGLPLDCLGRKYFILGYKNVNSGHPATDGSQLALVAPHDGTVVQITPSVDVKDDAGSVIHPAGVFYNINLNKGQTYQLRTLAGGPADLSGTLIQSNLPIGCYGGHRCTQINANGTFFCDTAVEMLLPVNAWGSQYCTVPLATRAGGDTIRAIAAMDNTTIRVNGAVKGIINRGQVLEWLEPNPAEITGVGATGGALPILVAQYANSHDYDGVVDSDPFMAMVQRSDSWMSDYCICAPPHSRFQDNYVNLIVPDQAQVLVIGEQGNLDISLNYSTHPCRGYRYARLKLPSTSNSFLIAADAPFGLMQYGWAEYESYGHPGAMQFGDGPPTLICPPEIVVYCDVDANGECYLRQIPDLRDQVQAFDDCDLVPPVIGQINPQQPSDNGWPPGKYTIIFTATDSAQNTARCVTTLCVLDETWEGLNFAGIYPDPGQISIWGGNADPDKDGLKNVAEKYLGTNPNFFDRPPIETALFGDGSNLMEVTYQARIGTPGARVILEGANNLSLWQSGNEFFEEVIEQRTLLPGGEFVQYTFRQVIPPSGVLDQDEYFARLKVEEDE